MKIIYVGAFRFPNFDAAAARVLNIGKALKAAGHEVEFISMGGKCLESDLQPNGSYVYQGFKYFVTHEIDCAGGFKHKLISKFTRGAKTILKLNDSVTENTLVIAYNPSNGLLKRLINLSRIKQFKLAADITEWYDYNELSILDWLPYKYCMTKRLKKISNKIVISNYLKNYYNDDNIIVVPATCDTQDKKWSLQAKNINVASFEGLTLIYAGNPAKKDSLHTAINVVNRLNSNGLKIRFLILGVTKELYLNRFANVLDNCTLSDNILFLGKVSQDLVPQYYHHADFMILLRENNRKSNAGFPTKFAEAMTAGVPVIANGTSDISKYLINGLNGYILDSPDYKTVENCLSTIYSQYNSDSYKTLKQNALNTGKTIFDYRNYIEILNQFVQSIKSN